METYHIILTGKGWQLKKEGENKVVKAADTKAELIDVTVTFLKDKTASLLIHSSDGKIQEERTYPRSADPKETRG